MAAAGVSGSIDLDYFLEVTGLGGPSAARNFAGDFEVASFSFGATNPASFGAGGGLGGAGIADFTDLHVTLKDEAGLASFLTLGTNGQPIESVSLIGVSPVGDAAAETYRINLADVRITDVHDNLN